MIIAGAFTPLQTLCSSQIASLTSDASIAQPIADTCWLFWVCVPKPVYPTTETGISHVIACVSLERANSSSDPPPLPCKRWWNSSGAWHAQRILMSLHIAKLRKARTLSVQPLSKPNKVGSMYTLRMETISTSHHGHLIPHIQYELRPCLKCG